MEIPTIYCDYTLVRDYENNTIEHCFHEILFILLFNVVLTFKSVDETLFDLKPLSSTFMWYSRSSRKRPPREFEKVVVTRAGRLQEYALVSDPMVKQ